MTKKKRYIVVPRTEAIKESGLRTGKRKLLKDAQDARHHIRFVKAGKPEAEVEPIRHE